MKLSLLDLQGSSDEKANQATLEEYTRILENPDLLGRLFRLFVYKHTRNELWKDLFNRYLERNSHRSHRWINDRKTNLERNLFQHETVTWKKFLEGLVILAPAFDEMTFEVFSTLNDGKVTSLRIRNGTLDLDDAKIRAIPKGEMLIPHDFHRSPLEPLPLKVVRDAITPIGTSAQFRKIVRENLKETTHSSKLSSAVNSLYVSVLKPDMAWKRMMAIIFALGATRLTVSIRATKTVNSTNQLLRCYDRMNKLYTEANAIFKELRDCGWVHGNISRRKAVRAICRVLALKSGGEISPPPTTFPYIKPFLSRDKMYNKSYLNQAFGTLRYLRGDYIGEKE